MKTLNKIALSAILSCAFSASAIATLGSTSNTAMGKVLIGENKLSLYTYRNDAPNQSNCYDDCATAWPPFFAKAGAKPQGNWSLVKRNDGKSQWAYKGAPLYYWVGDTKTGDISGHGVGGVWDLAQP